MPEASKPITSKEFQTYCKAQQNKMNQLRVKEKGSHHDNSIKKTPCFDCVNSDAKVGHEGCTQPGKKIHVPKNLKDKDGNYVPKGRNKGQRGRGNGRGGRGGRGNRGRNTTPPPDASKQGESEVRTKDDKEETNCSVCNKWCSDQGAHTTSEHCYNKRTLSVAIIKKPS